MRRSGGVDASSNTQALEPNPERILGKIEDSIALTGKGQEGIPDPIRNKYRGRSTTFADHTQLQPTVAAHGEVRPPQLASLISPQGQPIECANHCRFMHVPAGRKQGCDLGGAYAPAFKFRVRGFELRAQSKVIALADRCPKSA